MYKKKQTISPPAKYTVKESLNSPRNAPQEVIMSDTSIRANEDYAASNMPYKQTPEIYTQEYRAEVNNSTWQKPKSPQNGFKSAVGLQRTSGQIEKGRNSKALSVAQQQALIEMEKSKKAITSKSSPDSPRGTRQVQKQYEPAWRSEAQNIDGNAQNIRKVSQPGKHFTSMMQEPIPEATFEQSTTNNFKNINREEFQYVFPNGDRYSGTWNAKWIEGTGVYDFSKQNLQYRGEFKLSKFHGWGVLLRKPINGMREDIIYDGEWMNGYKEGQGKYYYFKETFYDGGWVKNVKEGHGTFKSPEGEYVGGWRNDKKHGKGMLRLINGSQFEGTWQFDQFVNGILLYSNGDQYEGDFANQNRNGYGVYNYTNNNTSYRGRWQNGQKSGTGVINYYNGDRYDGGMNADKREGHGCSYEWQKAGDRIKAEFRNDLPVAGKLIQSSGRQSDFVLQ